MPSLENVNQWESKKSWSISDYGVHPCILDKLRLHNFIQDMEKVRSLFQLAWNFLITVLGIEVKKRMLESQGPS